EPDVTSGRSRIRSGIRALILFWSEASSHRNIIRATRQKGRSADYSEMLRINSVGKFVRRRRSVASQPYRLFSKRTTPLPLLQRCELGSPHDDTRKPFSPNPYPRYGRYPHARYQSQWKKFAAYLGNDPPNIGCNSLSWFGFRGFGRRDLD